MYRHCGQQMLDSWAALMRIQTTPTPFGLHVRCRVHNPTPPRMGRPPSIFPRLCTPHQGVCPALLLHAALRAGLRDELRRCSAPLPFPPFFFQASQAIAKTTNKKKSLPGHSARTTYRTRPPVFVAVEERNRGRRARRSLHRFSLPVSLVRGFCCTLTLRMLDPRRPYSRITHHYCLWLFRCLHDSPAPASAMPHYPPYRARPLLSCRPRPWPPCCSRTPCSDSMRYATPFPLTPLPPILLLLPALSCSLYPRCPPLSSALLASLPARHRMRGPPRGVWGCVRLACGDASLLRSASKSRNLSATTPTVCRGPRSAGFLLRLFPSRSMREGACIPPRFAFPTVGSVDGACFCLRRATSPHGVAFNWLFRFGFLPDSSASARCRSPVTALSPLPLLSRALLSHRRSLLVAHVAALPPHAQTCRWTTSSAPSSPRAAPSSPARSPPAALPGRRRPRAPCPLTTQASRGFSIPSGSLPPSPALSHISVRKVGHTGIHSKRRYTACHAQVIGCSGRDHFIEAGLPSCCRRTGDKATLFGRGGIRERGVAIEFTSLGAENSTFYQRMLALA